MSSFSKLNRFTACLSICLIFLQPILSAAPDLVSTISAVESGDAKVTCGAFQNGMTYTLISGALETGALIKLSCATPPGFKQTALSELTSHAFFYGTTSKNREKICEELNKLSLDVDADTHLKINETEISLEFVLENGGIEEIHTLIELACDMVLNPLLEDEQIELSQEHLAQIYELEGAWKTSISSSRRDEAREFYQTTYLPQNINLLIISKEEATPLLDELSNQFGLGAPIPKTTLSPTDIEHIESLEEHVDWSYADQAYIIDGKICINEPNWINRSANGRALGAVLAAVGIGGIVMSLPISAPLVLAGGVSTATGLYLMFCQYMKDPYYIESSRKDDLVKGCAYAYRNERAGITLTPFERRFLFLNEIVNRPSTLDRPAILLIADLYRLNDPIMGELFTINELNPLIEIKGQFIQHRNHFKREKENLDNELSTATAPFRHHRDDSIERALNEYRQNSFVVAKENLKAERDQYIAAVKQAYKKKEITFEVKKHSIDEANKHYDSLLSHPDFVNGLANADITYDERKREIDFNYSLQAELCKRAINYDERLRMINEGVQGIIYYYNVQLTRMLSEFPMTVGLKDTLDLREV